MVTAGYRLSAMNEGELLQILDGVKDPEVPVLSIVELGIVRGVQVSGTGVRVTITPTYSGCPAMRAIEQDITTALEAAGFPNVTIETVYAPPWTTDWIGPGAREKLRAYGIAPPAAAAVGHPVALGVTVGAVPCPLCGSAETRTVSEFGATACKSLHVCNSCLQPFEHFKPF